MRKFLQQVATKNGPRRDAWGRSLFHRLLGDEVAVILADLWMLSSNMARQQCSRIILIRSCRHEGALSDVARRTDALSWSLEVRARQRRL